MGIDYSAALIVGLPRKDFEDQGKLEEWLENKYLRECPPYFDGSGEDDNICGIFLDSTYSYTPKVLDVPVEKTLDSFIKFEELTGMPAKLWLSPYGH